MILYYWNFHKATWTTSFVTYIYNGTFYIFLQLSIPWQLCVLFDRNLPMLILWLSLWLVIVIKCPYSSYYVMMVLEESGPFCHFYFIVDIHCYENCDPFISYLHRTCQILVWPPRCFFECPLIVLLTFCENIFKAV